MAEKIRLLFFKGVILSCLLFSFLMVHSQSKKELKYKEDLWSEIALAKDGEMPLVSDTMVVICTLRKFNLNQKKLFGEEMDSSDTIRYLLAIRNNANWKLFPMNSLEAAVHYLKKDKDVVFYIEGMGKTFAVNLYRSAGLSLQYNVNTILFDYPSVSLSYGLLKNFNFARNNALQSAPKFTRFIQEIEKSKMDKSPWIYNRSTTLFLHSMGNNMLKKSIVDGLLRSSQDSLFTSLALNAPCVSQRNHRAWVDSIQIANAIFIQYNTHDFQLNGAMYRTFRKQLGARITSPLSTKAYYVCFNEVAGKQHNIFLSRPGGPYIPAAAFNFYSTLFHGGNFEWSNSIVFSNGKKGIGKSLKNINPIP